jgi:hypothetical protein
LAHSYEAASGGLAVVLVIDVYMCCPVQHLPSAAFYAPALLQFLPPRTCFEYVLVLRRSSLGHHDDQRSGLHRPVFSYSMLHNIIKLDLIPPNPHSSSVAGGGPTGSTIFSIQCLRTASTFEPIPTLMYSSMLGWPWNEAYESRMMFDVHSCLVVSAWPVPMYLFCSASSCCWVRSLSAWMDC